MTESSPNPALLSPVKRILLAEDNPEDVFLLTEAFLAEKLHVEIDCVTDGDQLLERLVSLGPNAGKEYGIILLDVHLPRRSAEEVLMALNEKQRSLGVPLVVLTSIISERERNRFTDLGVKEIIAKPFDLAEYFALAQRLAAMLA